MLVRDVQLLSQVSVWVEVVLLVHNALVCMLCRRKILAGIILQVHYRSRWLWMWWHT